MNNYKQSDSKDRWYRTLSGKAKWKSLLMIRLTRVFIKEITSYLSGIAHSLFHSRSFRLKAWRKETQADIILPPTLGCLEAVRYRTVYGWAHDPRQSAPLTLRIQINGGDAGTTVADRPRPELLERGITSFDRGFEWSIPESYSRIDSVNVLTIDRNLALPACSEPVICTQTNQHLPSQWKSAGRQRLPSFFILGAAKCGTTSLHGYFGQHPEICVSEPKEPLYFELEFERGSSYYFNRYFSHWKGEPIVGEARHRNLYLPYVPIRIFHYNPSARLIVCVRNPAERAISHWWHWFSRHEEPLSLRGSIQKDLERIQSYVPASDAISFSEHARSLFPNPQGFVRTYLDSGYYYEQILRYLNLFPREQLRVVLFEDLVRDPRRVMDDLFEFVGADPGYALRCDYSPLNQSELGMLDHADGDILLWLVQHFRFHNELLSHLIGRSLNHWDAPFDTPGLAS